MGEFNQVLWTLDQEIAPQEFERLCTDLLCRDGYWKIVPVGGTRDRGRDAEAHYWRGQSERNALLVFQFSLQGGWEKKLRSDAAKIARHCPDATGLVFVTSRSVTGEKRDKLAASFKSKYRWALTIYDREWLRLRLEEMHTDLARKYLGVDLPDTAFSIACRFGSLALSGLSTQEIFRDQSPEQVRVAIVEATQKEPEVAAHWKRLAAIEDYLQNFQSALDAVNRALELDPSDPNLHLLKGSIIAELGIEKQSAPLLVQAKELFSRAVTTLGRAVDYYNLGNVLVHLGELETAEKNYLRCLELQPDYAQCWKNLGTVYVKHGRREKAMKCFEKALEQEPTLVEAHLSKATTWLLAFDDAERAVACFKNAYELEPQLDRRWPYGRYWYSCALVGAGQRVAALAQADMGLRSRPDDLSLLNQKANVLSLLWPNNPKYVDIAFDFFAFRAECLPNDYAGLAELIKLCELKSVDAWTFLERNLGLGCNSLCELAKSCGVTLAEFQAGMDAAPLYRRFRAHRSVEDHCVTLRTHGLSPNPGIVPALDLLLLALFGTVVARFVATEENGKTPDLTAAFETLPNYVSHVFTVFGANWLALERPSDLDDQTRLLSIGIIGVSDAVVAESARIIGFLAGHFGLPIPNWGQDNEEWSDLYTETGTRLMERVVSEWSMLDSKRL